MNNRYGQPPAVRSLRPLLLATTLAWALLLLVRLVGVVMDWGSVGSGPPAGGVDAFRAEQTNRLGSSLVLAVVLLVAALAGAGLLAAWTGRARSNAELISLRPHRHGPGMAAGCWFIPFANAVLPWQAVTDIWLASDPATRQVPPASGPASSRTVNVWWGALVGFGVLSFVLAIVLQARPVVTYDFSTGAVIGGLADYRSGLLRVAVLNTVLLLGGAAICVFTLQVLRRITGWHEELVGSAPALAAPVPQYGPPGPFPAPLAPQPFAHAQPLGQAQPFVQPRPLGYPAPPVPYPGPGWQPAPARPPNGLAIAAIVAVLLWLGTPWLTTSGLAETSSRGTTRGTMGPFITGFLGSIVLMIVAGILVIVWQVQARAAAIRFAGPAALAPGWTVASWFIPLANLGCPAWLMFGILQAGTDRRAAATDGLLVGAWWISWLAAWTCTWIAFSRSLGSIAEMRAAGLMTMAVIASTMWTVCAVLFAVIVALVRQRQLRVVPTGT